MLLSEESDGTSKTSTVSSKHEESVFPFEIAGMRDAGIRPVTLPCNTFGFAICAFAYPKRIHGAFWNVYLPAAVGLLLTLVFQVVLIYGVVLVSEDMTDHTCTEGHFALRVVCLCLFVVSCLNDLSETHSLHLWLQRLPASREAFAGVQLREYKRSYEDEFYEVQYPVCQAVTGITAATRFMLYAVVLVPKVGVAVALLVFGTPYVALASGNEAIIMNSLALGFLMEVDDMIFTFAATQDIRMSLERLSPLTLDAEELSQEGSLQSRLEVLWPSLSFGVPAAIVAAILHGHCTD